MQEEDTYYDAVQGDTLQSIARRFGLAIEKLSQLNPDTKGRETNIQVGEQILIETSNSEGDCHSVECSKKRKELPPLDVQSATRWENTHYQFDRRMLADTVVAIHKPISSRHDDPAMAVVNVATVGQYSPQDLFFVFSE